MPNIKAEASRLYQVMTAFAPFTNHLAGLELLLVGSRIITVFVFLIQAHSPLCTLSSNAPDQHMDRIDTANFNSDRSRLTVPAIEAHCPAKDPIQ